MHISSEQFSQISHFLCDYVSKWARAKPTAIAIIDADDGKWVMWKDFETAINIVFIEEMPLNRVYKTDYKILYDRVQNDVDAERARGGWDAR